MAKFLLPGFYEHFDLFKQFIAYKETYPHHFYEQAEIGACYGNFNHCIWDGGRIFFEYTQAGYEDIINVRDYYKSKNIPIRLIYTNPIITEEHLHNNFCNLVTELCEDENNEIVVNSSILEEYLRKTYPKYKFISSTTKCLLNPKDSKEELNKDYYMVCLDYNLNYNMEFLKSIPKEQKEKVEFLINAICFAGCQQRKEHYRLNGVSQLMNSKLYDITGCSINTNPLDYDTRKQRNNLTPEEIYNTYIPMGFSNFKIEGRTFKNLEVLLNIVKYMIKPEYQFQCILHICKNMGLNQ